MHASLKPASQLNEMIPAGFDPAAAVPELHFLLISAEIWHKLISRVKCAGDDVIKVQRQGPGLITLLQRTIEVLGAQRPPWVSLNASELYSLKNAAWKKTQILYLVYPIGIAARA